MLESEHVSYTTYASTRLPLLLSRLFSLSSSLFSPPPHVPTVPTVPNVSNVPTVPNVPNVLLGEVHPVADDELVGAVEANVIHFHALGAARHLREEAGDLDRFDALGEKVRLDVLQCGAWRARKAGAKGGRERAHTKDTGNTVDTRGGMGAARKAVRMNW